MTNQKMIPCTSGKCGVQSHIIGSDEQKSCVSRGPAKTGSINPITPSVLSQTNNMISLPTFRDDSRRQREALEKRDSMAAGTPPGKGLSGLIFRLRNNPEMRKEAADKEYAEGRWEDKVKQSFKNILTGARDARPSIEGGESVKPFKVSGSNKTYSDIKYVKDRDNIHITATESDGSETVLRYGSAEIMFRNEFPDRSVSMLNSGYLTENSAVYNPRSPYESERAQEYIELLAHCQNENNWQ